MNSLFRISLVLSCVWFNGVLFGGTSNTASSAPMPFRSPDSKPVFVVDHFIISPSEARSSFLLKLILNPQTDIRDRLEASHSLGGNLKRSEVEALYSFLKNHPDSSERNLPGLRALKNDVINALKKQTCPPAGLT